MSEGDQSDVIQFKTEMTREDLAAAIHYGFSRKSRLGLILALGAGLFAFHLIRARVVMLDTIFVAAMAAGAAVSAFVLFMFVVRLLLVRYAVASQKAMLGWREYTFSPDGLNAKAAMGDGSWRWEGVMEVAKRDRYVFFVFANTFVHVVPKRAFPSEASFESFYARTLAWWRASQPSPVARS